MYPNRTYYTVSGNATLSHLERFPEIPEDYNNPQHTTALVEAFAESIVNDKESVYKIIDDISRARQEEFFQTDLMLYLHALEFLEKRYGSDVLKRDYGIIIPWVTLRTNLARRFGFDPAIEITNRQPIPPPLTIEDIPAEYHRSMFARLEQGANEIMALAPSERRDYVDWKTDEMLRGAIRREDFNRSEYMRWLHILEYLSRVHNYDVNWGIIRKHLSQFFDISPRRDIMTRLTHEAMTPGMTVEDTARRLTSEVVSDLMEQLEATGISILNKASQDLENVTARLIQSAATQARSLLGTQNLVQYNENLRQQLQQLSDRWVEQFQVALLDTSRNILGADSVASLIKLSRDEINSITNEFVYDQFPNVLRSMIGVDTQTGNPLTAKQLADSIIDRTFDKFKAQVLGDATAVEILDTLNNKTLPTIERIVDKIDESGLKSVSEGMRSITKFREALPGYIIFTAGIAILLITYNAAL